VVGGGRVGTYLACRLRKNCKAFDRIVLKRREGDAGSLGRVALLSERLCAAADVEQTSSYHELGQPDVVFLAVKTYDLSAAAAELAAVGMRPRMLVRIRCTSGMLKI
jgi:ketopantoate reductase